MPPIDAGSEFIVAPGLTEKLGAAAIARDIPFLPGIANAGDIMRGLDLGLTHFKFFPAEASGGISALKALIGPFGQCRFCPTGGIREDTAPDCWRWSRCCASAAAGWSAQARSTAMPLPLRPHGGGLAAIKRSA